MDKFIEVQPRINGLSIEVWHCQDDVETWYNGPDVCNAVVWLNKAMSEHPDLPVRINDKDLKGYLFTVRRDNSVRKFFKPLDTVENPFYNRKVYENSTPNSTVSFRGINLD